jgi:hypothetical protein
MTDRSQTTLPWWAWPIVYLAVGVLVTARFTAFALGGAMIWFGVRYRRYIPPEVAHRASIYALRIRYWSPIDEGRH